jgi:hypothetical protein
MILHAIGHSAVAVSLLLAASLMTGCEAAEQAGTEAGSQVSGTSVTETESSPTVTAPAPVPSGEPAPSVTELAEREVPEDTTPKSGTGSATAQNPATLDGVRTARHEGFDRVVIDFTPGPLPSYEVAWVPAADPFRQPGSGKPVQLKGNRGLEVTLRNTANGDPAVVRPDLPAVREIRTFSHFEGVASMGIGVATTEGSAGEAGFRVNTIEDGPPRLVIDIAHADSHSRQLE